MKKQNLITKLTNIYFRLYYLNHKKEQTNSFYIVNIWDKNGTKWEAGYTGQSTPIKIFDSQLEAQNFLLKKITQMVKREIKHNGRGTKKMPFLWGGSGNNKMGKL